MNEVMNRGGQKKKKKGSARLSCGGLRALVLGNANTKSKGYLEF